MGVAEVVQQVLVHGELELGHPVVDQPHAVVRGLQRVTLHNVLPLDTHPLPVSDGEDVASGVQLLPVDAPAATNIIMNIHLIESEVTHT